MTSFANLVAVPIGGALGKAVNPGLEAAGRSKQLITFSIVSAQFFRITVRSIGNLWNNHPDGLCNVEVKNFHRQGLHSYHHSCESQVCVTKRRSSWACIGNPNLEQETCSAQLGGCFLAPRTVWLACVGRLAFLVCVCL